MNLLEAIYSQRSMRRLKPDPVPEELIWQLLDAAVRAPSGGNRQPWNFIVIRDPEIKQKIADYYLDGWLNVYGSRREAMLADEGRARIWRSADYLAQHLAEAPFLILATVRLADVAPVTPPGANVYPALQNLMLAARALGLGTTLTTLHRYHEAEVKQLLGIPDGHETMALIPLGWPRGKFGKAPRLPAEQVTFWDKWGQTRER